MLEINQYKPLLEIAASQITVKPCGLDSEGNWLDFVDLSFASKDMFINFKKFCKAEGIKTRRLANAKDSWANDRYDDDRPFAKRLRVQKTALTAWIDSNTDYSNTKSLQQALDLLMLATISKHAYSIYASENLAHIVDERVIIYRVDDSPLQIFLQVSNETNGPKLAYGSFGWQATNLRSMEYESLDKLTAAINDLNADKKHIEVLLEKCKNAKPKISNSQRQDLTGNTTGK